MQYTDELKARPVELVIHAQADPSTANGAISRVANELGVSKEALRMRVRNRKATGRITPVESVDLKAEIRRSRAELAEAKRADELLKRSSAFFAAVDVHVADEEAPVPLGRSAADALSASLAIS
ncbi:hypothetical protein [Gulosibacter sp. 10]|uniref:hypothetical protein n=1 Tax=Gulosibacter sp. 10 TaxID=1255570 RepID=UPI000B35F6CA|nr:hypothetical protein [Gulosibacter sp. 10]